MSPPSLQIGRERKRSGVTQRHLQAEPFVFGSAEAERQDVRGRRRATASVTPPEKSRAERKEDEERKKVGGRGNRGGEREQLTGSIDGGAAESRKLTRLAAWMVLTSNQRWPDPLPPPSSLRPLFSWLSLFFSFHSTDQLLIRTSRRFRSGD